MQLRLYANTDNEVQFAIEKLSDIDEVINKHPEAKERIYQSLFEGGDSLKNVKRLFEDWNDLQKLLKTYSDKRESIYLKIKEQYVYFVITVNDMISFVELFPNHKNEIIDLIIVTSDELNAMIRDVSSVRLLCEKLASSRGKIYSKIIGSDSLLLSAASSWSDISELIDIYPTKKRDICERYMALSGENYALFVNDCDDIKSAIALFPKNKEEIYKQCFEDDGNFRRIAGSWFVNSISKLITIFPNHAEELKNKMLLAFDNTRYLSISDMELVLLINPKVKSKLFQSFMSDKSQFEHSVKSGADFRLLLRMFPANLEDIYKLLISSEKLIRLLAKSERDINLVITTFPAHVDEVVRLRESLRKDLNTLEPERSNVISNMNAVQWSAARLYKPSVDSVDKDKSTKKLKLKKIKHSARYKSATR